MHLSPDKSLLGMCDALRNETLVELGVRLEDKEGTSVVKLIGKEAILKEKEREKQVCNYTTGIGYFIYPFIICAFSCKKRNSNREKIRRRSWKKLG